MLFRCVRKRTRAFTRGVRGGVMVARALTCGHRPILAHIIPTRRCNLACKYCNEFDSISLPVPTAEMLRRIDLLAALGTTVVTISGGEPLLHPDLDQLTQHIRRRGMMATLITNGYLLTPERIARLNRVGLDQMEISIDNVQMDDVSKKSLKVLDRKLQWLAELAEFGVNVNSVVGSGVRRPEDALVIARRARELGLTSTVGIIHDHSGQLQPLDERQQAIYDQIVGLETPFYTAALYNRFHRNVTRGVANEWHCRAGSRYLYICENGLVHYCSQQRGYPAIPLEAYTREHLEREYHAWKPCACYCTIGCVQRMAMIDELRETPLAALQRFFPVPSQRPAAVRALSWLFIPREHGPPTTLARAASWLLAVRRSTDPAGMR